MRTKSKEWKLMQELIKINPKLTVGQMAYRLEIYRGFKKDIKW